MKIEVGGTRTKDAIEAHRARIADIAASLGQRYSVRLSLPSEEAQHLEWFDAGTSHRGAKQPARPVFTITPDVQRRTVDAVTARVRVDLAQSGRINTLLALQAGAQAIRETWVERLSLSGADIRWAPLAPRYALWKHRKGLDPRIGVARGLMLAAVRGGLVVVTRTA